MARPPSTLPAWLRSGFSIAGFLAVLGGLDWVWHLRDLWPRAATDPFPTTLRDAVAIIIGGLYLVNKGR
jgi:hypothetical protein